MTWAALRITDRCLVERRSRLSWTLSRVVAAVTSPATCPACAPSAERRLNRSKIEMETRLYSARLFHRGAIVIRTGMVLVLVLVALTTGVAWAAYSPFPLAVLQTVGLASRGNLRGVEWSVSSPSDEPFGSVSIAVREQSAHFRWYRLHREARGRRTRYFYLGSWPAGIRTSTMRRPYKRRLPDGSRVEYRSSSMVFFELPLWGLCLISAPYPIVVLFRGPIRRRRRRSRGECVRCGYDLRGNESGACPECGTTIAAARVEASQESDARE